MLPLENLSGDPGQDYFADGMTEALTGQPRADPLREGDLAHVGDAVQGIEEAASGDRPRARASTRSSEGSFARSGDRVRITAQLIQGETEAHVWAKSFERELGDVLTLQGEIARAIAGQIEAELTLDERSRLAGEAPRRRRRPTRPTCAVDSSSTRAARKAVREALEQFNRALEIQDDYAAAYAGIASYYAILPFYSSLSPAEVFPKARAAAEKAVELDDGLAEAHASLAYVRAYYEWDWAAADREFKKALELRPSFADAHFSYSRFLAASGRMAEAVAEIRKAEELDPRELSLKANTALLSYFQGRNDDALKGLLEILQADPSQFHGALGHRPLLRAEGHGSRSPGRAPGGHQGSRRTGTCWRRWRTPRRASGSARRRARFLAKLKEQSRQNYVPSYYFALIYTGLGESDRAFEWLERAYQERSTVLAYLRLDPRLAPLRSDPRYASLVKRLQFPS